MYARLLSPPARKSFFLFGPRGTGKTTWVKTAFPNGLYLDLLEAEVFNELIANPQRLDRFVPVGFRDWVIIDEIQRVPDLLNEVHRLVEARKLRFVLTGSSARKLKRSGPNLLAGRALMYKMHPLTARELGNDFDLSFSLQFGHLPAVYGEEAPKKYLESYVTTYLSEEIQQEGLTRNLSGFARFLETASFSQGSVVNMSEIAREAMIERKVVEHYFSILEDLLIGVRIPPFTKRAKRRLLVHPKFYFFDVGVYRAVRPMGPLDLPEFVEGIAAETLFFQELMATNDELDLGYRLHYFRTRSGTEVDFIAYGDRGIRAFEVKRTGKVSPSHVRGLKQFLGDYPSAKGFLIYQGKRRMREGAIDVWPMEDALKRLPELLS